MEDFSTLLLGETGTGKGEAAAAIGRSGFIPYLRDKRRFAASFTESFIAINLSQFPETLIESELFGHRKGSFTGAIDHHPGVFERCNAHGALFLDEIGEVSLAGADQAAARAAGPQLHCRSAATSRSASRAVSSPPPIGRWASCAPKGRFRDDFYYRLCSDVIEVPTLAGAHRRLASELEDLVRLTVSRIAGGQQAQLMPIVLEALRRDLPADYAWPGNVRELEQAVRRILLTGRYTSDSGSAAAGREEEFLGSGRLRPAERKGPAGTVLRDAVSQARQLRRSRYTNRPGSKDGAQVHRRVQRNARIMTALPAATLTIGAEEIDSPTREDVERALGSPREEDWYMSILLPNNDCMEAYLDDGGFEVECEENGLTYALDTVVDEATVKSLMLSFLESDGLWKTLCKWEEPLADPISVPTPLPTKGAIAAMVAAAIVALALFVSGHAKWIAVLFALAFPGLIVFAIVSKMREVRRASTWTQGSSRIVKSRIVSEERELSGGGTHTVSVPEVEYEFSIGFNKFTGKRISIGEIVLDTAQVKEAVERYRVGTSVPVYYDPRNPAESVLERELPENFQLIWDIRGGVCGSLRGWGGVDREGFLMPGNVFDNSRRVRLDDISAEPPKG